MHRADQTARSNDASCCLTLTRSLALATEKIEVPGRAVRALGPCFGGGGGAGAYSAAVAGGAGRPQRSPSGERRSLPAAAPGSQPRHVSATTAKSLKPQHHPHSASASAMLSVVAGLACDSLCVRVSGRANRLRPDIKSPKAVCGDKVCQLRTCSGDLRRVAGSSRGRRCCCCGTASCAPPWTGLRARRPSTAPGRPLKPGRLLSLQYHAAAKDALSAGALSASSSL